MKRFVMAAAVLFAAMMFPAGAAHAEKPLRFVFISCCKDIEFFSPVKQGMKDAAAAMNVACEFIGTEGVDLKEQEQLLRDAVADGVDGIAMNIIDAHAFDAAIADAIAKGIPVVAFNVDAQAAAADKKLDDGQLQRRRLSAVCQDFPKAGRTLGEKALGVIPEGTKVLITQHDHGISALDERMQGIQEVLKTHGIETVTVCTGDDPQKGIEIIQAALKADPAIRVVLGTGQSDTEEAGIVVEREGKGLKAGGFDFSTETLRLLKNGSIFATIDQQPYSQGYYPVVQLTLYCRFGIQPSDIDAGAGVITAADVDRVMELSRSHCR